MRAVDLSLGKLLGAAGPAYERAMRMGLEFLRSQPPEVLFGRLGQTIGELPAFEPIVKQVLPDSYGGQAGPGDDFLVGQGMFYLTEQRQLCLDCTSGHYQMIWGYNHPALCAATERAVAGGIVWDNHSNLPQAPVKQLARRLVQAANRHDDKDPLDKALLGVCTGSVACEAALKIQLAWFEKKHGQKVKPVFIVMDGNYHGTGLLSQYLRGMWERYWHEVEVIGVQPNDVEELEAVFKADGLRVAGFWAEPVMMNREAIPLAADYLRLARRLCDETGALMCLDEIQTGFWQPEIFSFPAMGFKPDLAIAGKGMTAGFHPLSAVIFKRRYDILEQYDAISTNGTAPLASYLGLCCMEMIEAHGEQIMRDGAFFMDGLSALAESYPELIADARGRRHMGGLKFHQVSDAFNFHRMATEAGLWVRVHAYHPGHSTVLTKLGLLADRRTIKHILDTFDALLNRCRCDRNASACLAASEMDMSVKS